MNPYDPTQTGAPMDFFQSMLKGSGVPSSFASWMAPTVDADEIERKIIDLRAVLQWLEANVRLTQATIQALEVQRMTLSTLKTMNVDLGALATQMGEAMRAGAQAMGSAAAADAKPEPRAAAKAGADAGADADGDAAPIPGLIDPVQWWNSLSGQFAKVAAEALRDSAWPAAAAGAAAGASESPGAKAGSTRAGSTRAANDRPPAKTARKRSRAGGTAR